MKFSRALAVVGAVAVPTAAFMIRMYEGDTHDQYEEIISPLVRSVIDKALKKEERRDGNDAYTADAP